MSNKHIFKLTVLIVGSKIEKKTNINIILFVLFFLTVILILNGCYTIDNVPGVFYVK